MQNRDEQIRKNAKSQNEAGKALLENEKKEEAYKWFVQAVNEQKKIKKTERTTEDWYLLAWYQGMAGVACTDEEEKLIWFTKAFNNYKRKPGDKRTPEDWRTMGLCCNNLAVLCKNAESKFNWYKKGLKCIRRIPKIELIDEDQRLLAHGENKVSKYVTEPMEKILRLNHAVQHIKTLPLTARTKDDWHNLANYQYRLGRIYKKQGDWQNAWLSFQAALDVDEINYRVTASCYKKMRAMANHFTLDEQINTLAQEIFSDINTQVSDLKKILYKIHFQLLHRSKPESKQLLQLLKLMRLIEKYANRPDFPNKNVTAWLNEPKELQNFKRLLHEVEEAHAPSSLANLLDQGQSVTMAMALEIKILKSRVSELEQQNQELRVQLHTRKLPAGEKTHYSEAAPFTVFQPKENTKKMEGNAARPKNW